MKLKYYICDHFSEKPQLIHTSMHIIIKKFKNHKITPASDAATTWLIEQRGKTQIIWPTYVFTCSIRVQKSFLSLQWYAHHMYLLMKT